MNIRSEQGNCLVIILLIVVIAILMGWCGTRKAEAATPPHIVQVTKLGDYQTLAIVKVNGPFCRAIYEVSYPSRYGVAGTMAITSWDVTCP